MKKLQLFSIAGLAALVLATVPVGAFTFKAGDNLGKLTDYSSFYSPSAVAAGATPNAVGDIAVGDWSQTIFSMTTLYSPPAENQADQYYTGSPELVAMVSDLKVSKIVQGGVSVASVNPLGATTVVISLSSAGRYAAEGYTGGRVDLWVDPANNFLASGAGGYPADWGYGTAGSLVNPFTPGNYDTFPTATDGTATPLLSGTLDQPDPNGNAGVVFTINLNLANGTGVSDQGFISVLYNPTGIPFENEYLAGLAQISFFENFKFYPNSTLLPYETANFPFDNPTTLPIYWDSQSQDPITFNVLPEPATMSLLGMALVGLGGRVLRRRSK
jgi:hypothetical protein